MQKFHKRAVIKEELVALTGCYNQAIVLNQMLYWLRRRHDYARFLEEEREEVAEPVSGWIFKAAGELCDELMVTISPRTLGRWLERLVAAGWLARRSNPKHRWDRCWQYRPNVRRIQQALAELGYTLDEFPDLEQPAPAEPQPQPLRQTRPSEPATPQRKTTDDGMLISTTFESSDERSDGSEQDVPSRRQNDRSSKQNDRAIPEITYKITPKRKRRKSTTTTKRRKRRKAGSGGGICHPDILEACDEVGIYEPKRSLLARMPHIIKAGPEYVTAHADNAPSLGAAIWRMEAGWQPKRPKRANDFDWESIVHR